jgi:cell division protease FtsH
MSDRDPQPPGVPNKPPKRSSGPLVPGGWIWLLILIGILLLVILTDQLTTSNRIEYGEFKQQIRKDNVTDIRIGATKITGVFKSSQALSDLPPDVQKRMQAHENKFSVLRPTMEDPELLKELAIRVLKHDFDKDSAAWVGPLLFYLIPTLLLLALFFFILLPRIRDPMGGGFLSNYIKSPAKRYEKTKTRVTFDDVADMESAKGELQEVVEFLRSPEKFQRLGGQIPKGVLLIGPPGTGKTLLARAVAGEAGVPFYSINGSEFIQMFVGVGASRVRDLFKTARESSPCILFIDEIDAVGRVRGAGLGGGHDEREQTLNQILSEMDGFLPTETLIVIAATNRPDVLDPALLRPGRFDRHVTISRPTWQGRLAILKVHTRDKPLDSSANLETIARAMIGMTGADLRNLANEAALLATREGKTRIDRTDFERAADRVLIGAKREEVLTPEDKRKTAYHEAGHALIGWLEPGADRPLKVSIIPRGQALGVNLTIPEEERFHHGMDFFKARLVILMGGRAADRLVYNQPFAGAEMDLKEATRLARMMITHWGMSEKLGPVAYRIGEEHVFLGKEIQEPRDFSEGTAQLIDQEVRQLLQQADDLAIQHLQTHRRQLDQIVEALLQREELSREELDHLIQNGSLPPAPAPSANGEPLTVLPLER